LAQGSLAKGVAPVLSVPPFPNPTMGCTHSSAGSRTPNGPATAEVVTASGKQAEPTILTQRGCLAKAADVNKGVMMFHIGTNNWQRQGEFAPGSGILHASFHDTFNSMPGVKCYSIYPSKVQTNPEGDSTFRIFKLSHDIPICESASPNSSFRWHSMSEEEFAAYRKRLEDEVCAFMDEIELREGCEFDYIISHHAFTNAMVGAAILERRRQEGKTKLKHFNFVHGTALKMYIKEKEKDPEYPMRFLTKVQEHGVFNGNMMTSGVFVNSEDYIGKFLDCFPSYARKNLAFSRIGVNQNIFCPKGLTVKDMSRHLRAADQNKLAGIKRLVTFVGKFADWKRLDAVLRAAAVYEATLPDVATMVIGSGPPEAVAHYEGLAKSLALQRTFFLGSQGQAVLAEVFSASELGIFPSYKEPFGMVFIECMACGTPTIGARSGGPVEFVTPDLGVLVPEVEDWRSDAGSQRLGEELARTVVQALREDWKGGSKGRACLEVVKARYSTISQCQDMLDKMRAWSKEEPVKPCPATTGSAEAATTFVTEASASPPSIAGPSVVEDLVSEKTMQQMGPCGASCNFWR